MTSIQGDIGNLEDVSAAVKGADCVIHIAGIISIGTHPNVKAMKAINVDGNNFNVSNITLGFQIAILLHYVRAAPVLIFQRNHTLY